MWKIFLYILKWLKRAIYLSVILIVLGLIALIFLDEIVKCAINNSASYADLNAQVEDVDIYLFTQKIVLKNISIKNPDGFPENDAFFASKLSFKLDLFNLKSGIKRVYLQNAKICVEGRSGRRIMPKSFLKSNVYVIARELGRTFDVKLEQVLFGKPEKSQTKFDGLDYLEIRERFDTLKNIDEIRLENITISNGADSYNLGSVICNENVIAINDFKATVFGVKFWLKTLFFDIQNTTFGFNNFSVRNPEGFPRNSVFAIKKFTTTTREEKGVDGKITPRLNSIEIDSPTIYFEDKKGSMLGAIGMENNFAGLYNTINSMTHTKLGDMFQDEFENVPKSQEFKLPEIKWDNINIVNTRLICSGKDAGLLANKINIGKNKIDIDDIRAHVGGLKLQLDGVTFDSEKQLFIAKDFVLQNPAGFPEESAFRFRNFTMSTNFSERVLRGNRVMQIDNIEVNKFSVRLDSRSGDIYDLIGNDNNLYAVLDSIDATTKAMPVYTATQEKQINENKNKRPYRYIVKNIKFRDGKIFIGPRGDSIKIPFDDVIESEVGVEQKGLTSQQITTFLLKKIIINSIDGAQDKVSEEIGGVILAPIISVLRVLITIF